MTEHSVSGHQLGLEIASAKQNITLLRSHLKAKANNIDAKYFDDRLASLSTLLETIELERRDTREQQRVAALYEVSKVIGSSLNLQTVLDQVMDAIIQLTAAERGFLMLLDDDGNLDVRVARDFDQETLSSNDIAFSRTITRQVFETGEPVLTTNAQEDPRYAGQASIIAHAMRSIMASPLRARGQTIGVVYVDNRIRTGLFSDDDLRALDAFASQAAVAIDNARLYSETDALLQERVEELRLLQWIDRQFNESLESQKIMNLVLEWASRLGDADSASIGFVDNESKVVRWAASYGEDHRFSETDTMPFSDPLVSAVFNQEDTAIQVDHDAGQTLLSIPVRLENRIIALVFFRAARADAFDENARSLMSRVADRAAIALQNGRLYEAVKAADRAKTEFVSVVAHELKVPMTSIQGYASMLERIGELNAQQQKFVQTVVDNVERMKVLVNDLSDISRIESGQLHIDVKPVELPPLLEQARNGVMAQIEERGHTFVEDIEDNLPPVQADGSRLVQVLVNLLSNAYKYTPDNGTITLQVKSRSDAVQISVQDTGVGMTPEQVQQLGTKFVRFDDNEHVAQQAGTGLGFAITRNLIELMEGNLHIESTANVGSTFTFTLPVAKE
jgi:signal transduction histidine kinase